MWRFVNKLVFCFCLLVFLLPLKAHETVEVLEKSISAKGSKNYAEEIIANWSVIRESREGLPTTNAEIRIWLPRARIRSVVKSGFKNAYQLQPRMKQQFFSPESRNRLESEILGKLLPLESIRNQRTVIHQLRPKYGQVYFSELPGSFYPKGDGAMWDFGDVAAVLNPEVKRRSLIFLGDSGYNPNNEPMKSKAFKFGENIPLEQMEKANWIEAIIYGELNLDDVKEWQIINRDQGWDKDWDRTYELLLSTNKPVRTYDMLWIKSRGWTYHPTIRRGSCVQYLKRLGAQKSF